MYSGSAFTIAHMVSTGNIEQSKEQKMLVLTSATEIDSNYDKKSELKAFGDTKAGVKGLLDAGVTKVPRIFRHEWLDNGENSACNSDFSIPIIDLKGILEDSNLCAEAIDRVCEASEKGGFFQVINHGIPVSILDEMIDGVRKFHEQDVEVKKGFYSCDWTKKVAYFSSLLDRFTKDEAQWKDSFRCAFAPDPPQPEELPEVCRDIMIQYTNQAMQLADKLSMLLSRALGLSPSHLKEMGCTKEVRLMGHYYPACPEPELTIGTSEHTDPTFITIVLQDQIGGLQVLHKNQWVDVSPVRGGLVVNIGDLLQIMSNDRFKSANHRVLSKKIGPRISVACFIKPPTFTENASQQIEPIKELLSKENPPVYKETNVKDFLEAYNLGRLRGTPPLLHLRL